MSKHDHNDLLNPANSLSPLNPFSLLNPNYEQNVEGLASAIDEMPEVFIKLLGWVWLLAFIGADVPLGMLGTESWMATLQKSSIGEVLLLLLFYVLFVVRITVILGILGTIGVGICLGIIALFVFLYRSIVSFVKWICMK